MIKEIKVLISILVLTIGLSQMANGSNSDTLLFKGNLDYPPYQSVDENGSPTGFSVDLLKEIAETMGLNIKIEMDSWDKVRKEIENGLIDGVLAMSYSVERSRYVEFSIPYVYLSHSIFVRNGSNISQLDDLENKSILVVRGDIMHDYLLNNYITNNIIPVTNYKDALEILSEGKYDCALINTLQGQYAIHEYQLKNIELVGIPFESKSMCFAVKKGSTITLALLNDGLNILKETGEYQKIYDKWFAVYEEESAKETIQKIIRIIIAPLFILFAIIFVWIWSLRRQVASKTKQLRKELAQKKETQHLLIQEKSILDSLVNSIPDLIFYKDKNNKYIGCNTAFTEFSGIKQNDLIDKFDYDIFPIREAKKYDETDSKILKTGKPLRYESWETSVDGKKVLFDVLKVPFKDEEGNIYGLLGICHDITYRYYYENALEEAKLNAEESDRLKTAFLANMSHEIRTPMNAIIGFADLLSDEDIDTDTREELISHINSNCNTLMHLIDDIIDLSQIEANELKIELKKTNINKVIEDTYEYFDEIRSKESKKSVSFFITQSIKLKASLVIDTDQFRLKQILANLVDNAIKYTAKGTIEMGYETDEFSILFYVKDTGPGIKKDDQAVIFNRFHKLENKEKLFRGTGLGLAISKNLVERLGGEIWVDSDPGKGAHFYFKLPLALKTVAEKPSKKDISVIENEEFKDKTIIVAEDELSNFKYISLLLEKAGFNVLHAKNGKEAIDLFRKNDIDIVLMDIKMPVMDGYEATKHIKSMNKVVPIIAQTAYAMTDDREKCLKAGCDDYITKPLKREKLFEMIKKLI